LKAKYLTYRLYSAKYLKTLFYYKKLLVLVIIGEEDEIIDSRSPIRSRTGFAGMTLAKPKLHYHRYR